MPPTFTPNIQWTLLKYPIKIHSVYIYGAITLYGQCTFQYKFNLTKPDPTIRTIHHIFTPISRGNSVCPLPFSLDVTNGITICFLFLCLLRCFSSAGSRSHKGSIPHK